MKYGRDLVIGDVLVYGSATRTITHFAAHPGLNGHTARIAYSGDWCITVFDDDMCQVFARSDQP